ncbi:unnamed protein product [Meloidogyne enterolobii]|uniref:Uncharacterized protein n=1 Tax=Meloidogyne enterolobii TaxID=390850 RepID=A0ACB0XWD6_MELEN
MDVYLRLTHSQLDIQLENVLLTEPKKQQQLNELLAQLLHIRNELTQLESREREAKNAAASAATRDSNKDETSSPKKALKTKNKGEKSSPRKESTNEETIKQQLPTTSGGPVEKEKSKGGGGSRLLKNTLKSLKKNL